MDATLKILNQSGCNFFESGITNNCKTEQDIKEIYTLTMQFIHYFGGFLVLQDIFFMFP